MTQPYQCSGAPRATTRASRTEVQPAAASNREAAVSDGDIDEADARQVAFGSTLV